jgi:two-component system nitrogen regulation sensor histidine kinase NtrY
MILISIFAFYLFNVSVKVWFDQNISKILDESSEVGKSYIDEHILQLQETAIQVSEDLGEMYYDIVHDPALFLKVLEAQAEMRVLDEAMIFHKTTGAILAQTMFSFSLSFANIPEYLIVKANQGEAVLIRSDPTKIRILIKLNRYDDTYLIIGRLVDTKIVDYINDTSHAISDYWEYKNNISILQIKFFGIFVLIAFTLIVVAIYSARRFAQKIVLPIRLIVMATEKVKNGDLSVRVPEQYAYRDEIRILTRAFNRMIERIDSQQQDLVNAQRSLAWSDVARRVAHEIKNPLTPINLSADMLSKKFIQEVSDKEVFNKYINNIKRNSNQIDKIVGEFISFARLPAAKFIAIDIVVMLNDIVSSMQLINSGIKYQFQTNYKNLELVCDPTQINQVLVNLIKNAEEALQDCNRINKKITVTLMSRDDIVEISIIDNGTGFSEEMLSSVPSPYLTSKTHGTGLGLAIVDRIIQDHLGKMVISNNPDGGACIKLFFSVLRLKERIG